MNRRNSFASNSIVFATLFFVLSLGMCNTAKESMSPTVKEWKASEGHIVLNSNSFNTKKRSDFAINGRKETIKRGLTIIHLLTPTLYEYKSFDTHGSEEEAKLFLEIVEKLQENKASYIVLAHDSASKALKKFSPNLEKLGFKVLSSLQARQAYVMHNFNGGIEEKQDDLTISLNLKIPKNIKDDHVYFPKPSYAFKANVDRYIAHAGGEVNGTASTNSIQALDQNYERGFRVFELDIIETSDGELVAAHDWRMWSRFTDFEGELPVSFAEFKKRKIYGKYDTMDMDDINKWFAEHPDAILVTDKVSDPIKFSSQFDHKDRLIMELFSLMAVEEASKNGITAMISQKPFKKIVGDKLSYLQINNIKHVALSRRMISKNRELLEELRDNDIKVYVYHVNFDEGKDEKYVLENEIGLVYGMYADKWVFDFPESTKTKAAK